MKTHAPYGMELTDECASCPMRKDGFFCQMATEPLGAFQKIKFTSSYQGGAVLFVEGQVPRGVYMLCTGRVKPTTTSPEGKTIIVRVVEAGELLGLHSAISGHSRGHGRNFATMPGRFRPCVSTPMLLLMRWSSLAITTVGRVSRFVILA